MYGCEALCALAEAYRWLRDVRFARSADEAMRFYDTQVCPVIVRDHCSIAV